MSGKAVSAPPHSGGAWSCQSRNDCSGPTGAACFKAHPAVCCLAPGWALPPPPSPPPPSPPSHERPHHWGPGDPNGWRPPRPRDRSPATSWRSHERGGPHSLIWCQLAPASPPHQILSLCPIGGPNCMCVENMCDSEWPMWPAQGTMTLWEVMNRVGVKGPTTGGKPRGRGRPVAMAISQRLLRLGVTKSDLTRHPTLCVSDRHSEVKPVLKACMHSLFHSEKWTACWFTSHNTDQVALALVARFCFDTSSNLQIFVIMMIRMFCSAFHLVFCPRAGSWVTFLSLLAWENPARAKTNTTLTVCLGVRRNTCFGKHSIYDQNGCLYCSRCFANSPAVSHGLLLTTAVGMSCSSYKVVTVNSRL